MEPFVLVCIGVLAAVVETPTTAPTIWKRTAMTSTVTVSARYWRPLVMRGIIAMAAGVVAFFLPGVTLRVIALLFACYALVDGIGDIASGVSHVRSGKRWSPQLIGGIVSLIAAVAIFVMPGVTAVVLLSLVAIWAIARGVFDIVAAVRLRREIEGEGWLALAGAMSVVFGVLLLMNPRAGLIAIAWWIALYAFVFGAILLFCGLRLHARASAATPVGGGRPMPTR